MKDATGVETSTRISFSFTFSLAYIKIGKASISGYDKQLYVMRFLGKKSCFRQLEIYDSYYFHYHDIKNSKWRIRCQELILGFLQ